MVLKFEELHGKATGRESQEPSERLLGELTELDPDQWPARLDRAVGAGELQPTERNFVLRVAGRLEKLRVMTVPSPFRWPETELTGLARRTFASEMIGRSDARPAGEKVAIAIESEGVDPALIAAFAAEPWPSIAWLRPELPSAGSLKRIGSREALRARKLKLSDKPVPSRRPVRSQ